ncbi:hypothetical protein [Paludisphaera soli]|uniref:hypothetical protein n=1 Tax=Paludisphaera soli TaxID=2712865 RepID=UPI0013ECEEA1|nr:hypothetical protein [Paludisphaera soli]
MLDRTQAILRDMEAWPWFEHVGAPIRDPAVIAVSSSEEAVECHRSYVWECLRLQVRNVNYRAYNARDWHRAQGLNPVVMGVEQILEPLFRRIRALGERLSLPEGAFYYQVRWDLIAIAVETELADLSPPLFSVPVVLPWYRAGSFPCGWDGPILDTDWKGVFPPYRLFVY